MNFSAISIDNRQFICYNMYQVYVRVPLVSSVPKADPNALGVFFAPVCEYFDNQKVPTRHRRDRKGMIV